MFHDPWHDASTTCTVYITETFIEKPILSILQFTFTLRISTGAVRLELETRSAINIAAGGNYLRSKNSRKLRRTTLELPSPTPFMPIFTHHAPGMPGRHDVLPFKVEPFRLSSSGSRSVSEKE